MPRGRYCVGSASSKDQCVPKLFYICAQGQDDGQFDFDENVFSNNDRVENLDFINGPRFNNDGTVNIVVADISTYNEGVAAAKMGADAVSTTLSGYTPYSPQLEGPDTELVARLSKELSVPVFAEGRINVPADVSRVMSAGAYAPIVGSAITRPQLITAKFAQRL